MPIYEYQCTVCGHLLEAFQSLSEAPLFECPACHGFTLNKLISAAGFQLKGSGWYLTDYSAKGKSKSSAESTASTPEATTAAQSEVSPAAKPTENTTPASGGQSS